MLLGKVKPHFRKKQSLKKAENTFTERTRRHQRRTLMDTSGNTSTHADSRDTYGLTPSQVVSRGHSRSQGNTRRHTRLHADVYEHTQTHAGTRGHTRTHADTHGHTRTHAKTRGHT